MTIRGDVERLLFDCPGGLTGSAIDDELSITPTQRASALPYLVRSGRVARVVMPDGISENSDDIFYKHIAHAVDGEIIEYSPAAGGTSVPDEIVEAAISSVEWATNTPRAEFLSKSRSWRYTTLRAMVATLLRERGASWPFIGRVLKKDHSTVMHAAQVRLPALMKTYPEIRRRMERAREVMFSGGNQWPANDFKRRAGSDIPALKFDATNREESVGKAR